MARGVREVTLLGQIVNLYGRHEFERHEGKSPFVQLLEALQAIDGLERIRFTSPHPIGFRDDLVACFRDLPKLMPHVHLPLQSGSDRMLKAMHRGYTAEKYLRLVESLRAARPGSRRHHGYHRRLSRRDGGRLRRHARAGGAGRLR